MAKEVKFTIKLNVDGKEQVVDATTDVQKLSEELGIAKTRSDEVRNSLLKMNNVTQALQNVFAGLQQITGQMQEFLGAYSIQSEAETKLANNMRNTMDAREEDIQSIKDLCSAQQQLGVIGDEVQLSGAQELATYLEKKSSLEKLIPVMNDMLAQQYGLNATQESAAQIATMLGKVMEGQVNALSRYGYKFDAAQENILKYGDEEQRAAVLADVVTSAVGGMNAELAKTDAGKAKQAANDIGDLKERIGELLAPIATFVISAGQLAMGLNSLATTATGIVSLSQAFGKLHLTTKLVAVAQSLWNKQVMYGRAYVVAMAAGAKGLAIQAAAARVAMMGLMALPVVAVIGAIAAAFGAFSSSADDATAATQQFNEAEQQAAGAAAQAKEEIEKELEKVNELIAANDESAATVQHLNQKYGDIFGTYSTLAQWQKVLSENESVYCRLIREESILHSLNAKIVEKETSLLQKRNFIDKVKENQSWVGKVGDWLTGMTSGWEEELTGAEAELASLKSLVDQTTENIEKIRSELKTGISEEKKTGFQLPTYNIQAMTIKELDNTIQHLTETISTNKDATDAQKKEMGAMISQMEKRKAQLEKLYGIEQKSSKTSKTRTKEHKRERTEYEKLGDEIKKLEDKAARADGSQLDGLRRQIAKLKERRSEIEATLREVNRPLKLDTLSDVNEELKYYQALLLVVGEERRKEVNGEIRQLETLAAKMTLAGHMQLNIADINDLRTLEEEEQYYQQLYNLATSDEERASIARTRVELEKKREALEGILETARKPAGIEELRTVEDLDKAIQWYGALQSRQSADEYAATQKTINALTAKKAAIERMGRVLEMQDELSELGTGTKTARLELKTMGFDGLESRIQELQAMLDDLNHPVTDKQRADILATIATYRQLEHAVARSFDTFKDGWGAVTGMVSGIQGLTNALADHKSAWDIATSAVDTFISIYEGIETVIQILRMLGILTEAHTASKVVEGGAVGTEAGVQTAAAAENAVAMGIETAAAKANTAALLEMAAAGYMAAHAYIPFAGFGIAAGYTASAAALVKSIGAMAFADGGLVSGPTLGLIGEYAGARSNPEVVAPLDRLRAIIGEGGMKGEVDFKIRGRRLVGILEKENRHSER